MSQTPDKAIAGHKIAYVLLWFPLSSETFIFREVEALAAQGFQVHVYTMYSKADKGWSKAMRDYAGSITRFGIKAIWPIFAAFCKCLWRQPQKTAALMRAGLFRKMRNLEATGENTWCFMAGFRLAELCKADGIELINSSWGNGSATAAWVASTISGIPFTFAGRAGDIYPPDGILAEKSAAASLIRANNAANVDWLKSFCPKGEENKVRLVYNGLTFREKETQERGLAAPPYKILAVGRFARTKGFPYLFTALARLKRENFPVKLTLVGDGSWKKRLLALRKRLRLENMIEMPGFVPNDRLADYMRGHYLLVVPSVVHSNGDRDGIPNVIMEACSLELPVVATDVCGISEVIRDGETGAMAPQRDAAALANAIRQQLENPQKAADMARNARDLVLKMFDTQANCAALANLYLEAMRGRNV